MKNKIAKALTIGAIGIMTLGTTVATSSSIPSLADYPAPLIENGRYNMLPVYGDNAKADDIAGAFDILAGLATSGVNNNNVEEGIKDNVNLGDSLDVEFNQLSDRDLNILQDLKINFNSEDYDVSDYLNLDLFTITNSLHSDNDYESFPALESKKGLLYEFEFEDSINLNETSMNKPLSIDFMGEKIKVIDVKSDTEMTILAGDEYFMNIGDSISSEGKTVTLHNVGDNAVVVEVDGSYETIRTGITEEVNGLHVTVDELFYRIQLEESSATLVVGAKTVQDISDGDSFIGEPSKNPTLKWSLKNLQGEKPALGVSLAEIANDAQDDNILIDTGCLKINEFANICLEGLLVDSYSDYTLEYDDVDLSGKAWILSSEHEEGFDLGNSKDTDTLVFDKENANNISVYYENEQGNLVFFQNVDNTELSIGNLEFEDSDRELKIDSLNYQIKIGDVNLTINNNWNRLDSVDVDGVNLDSRNEDVLTNQGSIIFDVENGLDDNRFEMSIPSDDQKAKVSIRSSEDAPVFAEKVIEVAPPMVKASEVTNPEANNLLLLGGPAVNSLTAKFIGDIWTFKPGEAIIELKANGAHISMIVAGTTAVDTRRACRVLRDYSKYDLKGTSVKVTGTSDKLTDIIVSSGTTTTTTLSGNQTA